MSEQKPPQKTQKPSSKPPAGKSASSGLKITVAEVIVAIAILIVLSIIYIYSSGSSNGTVSPIVQFINNVISVIKSISTIVSMLGIVIAAYSFIRIQEIVAEDKRKLNLTLNWESERNKKNARWQKVEEHMASLNPSDWKVAILEADIILDEVLERKGFAGSTLGERLKRLSTKDFTHLDDAWEVHKIRNAVAHKGADFQLSRSEAEHAINMFYRIFTSMGYL